MSRFFLNSYLIFVIDIHRLFRHLLLTAYHNVEHEKQRETIPDNLYEASPHCERQLLNRDVMSHRCVLRNASFSTSNFNTHRSIVANARPSEQEFKCLAEYYAIARSGIANESRARGASAISVSRSLLAPERAYKDA